MRRLSLPKPLVLVLLVAIGACESTAPGSRPDPLVETRTQAIVNGTLVSSGPFADTAVTMAPDGCRGTLLTNNWALSAWHCHDFTGDNNRNFFLYDKPCSTDADCSARGGVCLASPWGLSCGSRVVTFYDPPGRDTGNQVELLQLATPIRSGLNPTTYSIAQPMYLRDKNTLLNQTISIFGRSAQAFLPGKGDFTVTGFDVWSYVVQGINGVATEQGDSGGPGYYRFNNVDFLAGVTVAVGSQHDLAEVQAWLDDTLFDRPRIIKAGVQAYAQAMNATGAVAAYRSGNLFFFTSCPAEPCDARGAWTTPLGFLQTAGAQGPAIAADTGGAQVFVTLSNGMPFAYQIANGTFAGSTSLGGSCTGPLAAATRPNTSPPVIDVFCRGTDGNVYANSRTNGNWSGFFSIGQPPGGMKSGTAPAVDARDASTIDVSVVGNDGSAWMATGVAGGWTGWASLGGADLTGIAATSYAPDRIDLIAVTTSGTLYHRFLDGNVWMPHWLQITRGGWSATATPYAASFSGHRARMNVGSVDPWDNAHVQRYSDWLPSPPTVATAATASPATVTAATTALSALGAFDGGEWALSYTWTTTGTPPAPVSFSANGNNAAKNTTATFSKAGNYTIQVAVRDTAGRGATSSVNVTVAQTITTITVSPTSATVSRGATQQFTASARDQFGASLTTQPSFAWTVSGGGTINASGLFSATTTGGPFTVTASAGGKTGTASVTVSGGTTVTLGPTADTYVRDGSSAGTNFGTATELLVKRSTAAGNNRITYLRFSLASVGSTVNTAKLRLFGSRPTAQTTTDSVYAVSSTSWSETGITYNTRPTVGAKQSTGKTISTVGQYYEWDITSYVRAQKTAGATAISMAVQMDTAVDHAFDTFSSREAASNRPQLVVTGP